MAVTSANKYEKISAKTASYQLKPTDIGTTFTTRGAGGAITFTLPDTAKIDAGWWCRFYGVAGQNMAVASYGSSDDIVTFNDATADSVTFSTAGNLIGANVEVIWDGTGWLTMFGGANTVTVA